MTPDLVAAGFESRGSEDVWFLFNDLWILRHDQPFSSLSAVALLSRVLGDYTFLTSWGWGTIFCAGLLINSLKDFWWFLLSMRPVCGEVKRSLPTALCSFYFIWLVGVVLRGRQWKLTDGYAGSECVRRQTRSSINQIPSVPYACLQ